MKNSCKKAISVVLTVVMLLTAAPLSGFAGLELNLDWLNLDWLDFSTKSSALAATGQCGDNVFWTFDESTGTLTISGTGSTYDYDFYEGDSYHNGTYYSDPYCSSPFYQNSESVTAVIIQNGVTGIGSYLFQDCNNPESIIIPESVAVIGFNAFGNCTNLNRVNISSIESWCGITFIGNDTNPLVNAHNLYLNGEAVTDLIIPTGITSIKSNAFKGCTSIQNVTIHDGVTSIGANAFQNCRKLNRVNISSIESWMSISFTNAGSNPLLYAHNLYLNGELVTSLTIPNSMTSVNNYVFAGGDCLNYVTIPEGITTIGEGAFSSCAGLNEIRFPDSVISIGKGAFNDCYCIGYVKFGNGLKTIGDSAFYYCWLMSVDIPESVEVIGHSAFYNSYCDVDDPFILKVYGRNCTIYNDSFIYSNYNPDPDYPPSNTGLIVYGYADSTAYQYAVDNDLTFRYIYGEHEHTYTDECDTTCNICGAYRNVTHGQNLYITAQSADGEHTAYRCSNCGRRVLSGCGQYGENVFGYQTDDYTWIFFGSGAMNNYSYGEVNHSPFNKDFSTLRINKAIFEEGITYIGDYFLSECDAYKATIPSTLESISSCAFQWSSIGTIAYAEGTEIINLGFLVFSDAPFSTNIPSSAKEITGIPPYSGFKVYYDGRPEEWLKITGHELLDNYEIIYAKPSENTSVRVTRMPDKTVYHVNDNFVKIGMEVTVETADGATFTVNDYDVEYDFSIAGQQTVTVLYENLSTTITVDVAEHFLERRTISPTCSEEGEEYDICTECGAIFVLSTIPTVPHTYERIEQAATCTQAGRVYDKCSVCGDEVTVSELPKLRHNIVHYERGTTCTESGTEYDYCTMCGFKINEVIYPAPGHLPTHYVQDSDCVNPGEEYDICTRCGQKYNTIIIPTKPHTTVHVVSKESTCSEAGIEYDLCTVCNQKFNEAEIPLKEHTLTHVSINKTCTVDGEEYDMCSVCGEKLNRTVDKASGHVLHKITVSPTCTQGGMRFDYCIVCGEQQNLEYLPAAHSWSSWRETEITDSTLTLEHTCAKCSAAETKTVSNVFTGCNLSDGRISGLAPGMTFADFRDTYVNDSSVEISYSQQDSKIGTGSVVTVQYDDGTAVDFECLIFGDVNADGIYDGQDAFIVNCIANGMLAREQVGEAKYLAADCNHDGEVNSGDVLILEQAGLLLSHVDQSKEDYAETDAYHEYLDLIDQNPPADEAPADEPEAEPVSFLAKIIEIIKSVFLFIYSFITA